MKLAIMTPKQAGLGWFQVHTHFVSPNCIREGLSQLAEWEEASDVEMKIVSMHPVVISEVAAAGAKTQRIFDYEDVMLYQGKLVSLLDVFDADWLSHFDLGDLFCREELGPWERDRE